MKNCTFVHFLSICHVLSLDCSDISLCLTYDVLLLRDRSFFIVGTCLIKSTTFKGCYLIQNEYLSKNYKTYRTCASFHYLNISKAKCELRLCCVVDYYGFANHTTYFFNQFMIVNVIRIGAWLVLSIFL